MSIETGSRGGVHGRVVVVFVVALMSAIPVAPWEDGSWARRQPLDQSVVLLATVDTLPWPHEVLGLVQATLSAGSGIVPMARLMARLQDQALGVGMGRGRRPWPPPDRARVAWRIPISVQGGSAASTTP